MKSLLAILGVMLFLTNVVHADVDERDRHYEHAAKQPENTQEAAKILANTITEMDACVARNDYESVHELSYSLESSVKWLKKSEKSSELKKKQLELIELYTDLVHHGSEDGKFDKVHKYFPILKAESLAYLQN